MLKEKFIKDEMFKYKRQVELHYSKLIIIEKFKKRS